MIWNAATKRLSSRIAALALLCTATPAWSQGPQVVEIAPGRASETVATEAVVSGQGLAPGTQLTLVGSAAFFAGQAPAGPFAPGQDPLLVRDGLAYVSTQDLKIFDLSDPDSPQPIGQLDRFGHALALAGDILYLVEGATVTRVDVSDPASPSVIGSATAPVSCISTDADTLGQVLYVACGPSRPYILVWEDGAYVRRVTTGAPTTTNQANHVAVANGHAYVTDRERGLSILDLSDPTNPVPVGQLPPGAVDGRALTVDGDIVWLGGSLEVLAVDVSDPTAPFVRGRAPHYVFPVGMSHADGILYAMSVRRGPQLYDIRDPDDPRPLYPLQAVPFLLGYGVEATGDRVYALNFFPPGDLVVFDTTAPVPPGLGHALSLPGSAPLLYSGPAGSPGRLHVVAGDELILIDVSPGGPLVRRGSVSLPGFGHVLNRGNLDYVAGRAGLQLVEVGDPDQPVIVGQLSLPLVNALSLTGSTLFAATDDSIRLVDVLDPTSPTEIGSIPSGGLTLASGPGLLAVGGESDIVEIYTLGGPAGAVLAATLPIGVWSLHLEGTTLLLGTREDGLQIYDLGSPGSPAPMGSLAEPSTVFGIGVDGGIARVAGSLGGSIAARGQFVVDISDPTRPVLVGGTAQLATAGFLDDGWIYGFTQTSALRSWRLHPPTSAAGFTGGEATLSIPAGLSPGFYDVIATGPDGFSILRRGFEVLADSDGDGSPDVDDCDPDDSQIYPGAVERPGNAVDENCDGRLTCDPDAGWRAPGAYRSCVAASCADLVEQGLLSGRECGDLVAAAARRTR